MKLVVATSIAAALAATSAIAAAQERPTADLTASASSPYAPFAFLIGEWRSIGQNGATVRQRFRWGPQRSYIFYTTFVGAPGRPEAVHFEGMLVWNGATGRLDFLIVIEPGSGGQERGEMRVEPDGSIVRDVLLTTPAGRVSQFRQTFRSTGPDTAVTALMRNADGRWVPSFPGADNLTMARVRP